MIMLENVFWAFMLAHLITKFEPFQWTLDVLSDSAEKKPTIFLLNMLKLATGCFKCCSLYVGFFMGGFWCGVMTSFFAYIYQESIAPFIEGIRFTR